MSQLGVMISLPLFKLPWNICHGKPHQIRHNLSDQSFSVFLRTSQAVVENYSLFLRRNMVFNKDRWIENRTSAPDLVLPLICSGIRGQSLHLNRPQPPCERNENCVDFKAPFSSVGCGFTICRASRLRGRQNAWTRPLTLPLTTSGELYPSCSACCLPKDFPPWAAHSQGGSCLARWL